LKVSEVLYSSKKIFFFVVQQPFLKIFSTPFTLISLKKVWIVQCLKIRQKSLIFSNFFFLFRLVFLKTKNETFLRTFLPTVCLSSHLILSKNTVQNCVEILPSNISPPVCSKIGFQNQKHLSKAFEKKT